jgi:nitroreductase
MSLSQSFDEIIEKRRSNRKFDPNVEVPNEVIKKSLERAILSPNSSNMQLWEFYWIQDPALQKDFHEYCLNQNAAKTAKQLVVFVTRQDHWKQRVQWHLDIIKKGITGATTPSQDKLMTYYGKLMPLAYGTDQFGFLSLLRRSLSGLIGAFRPMTRMKGRADQRITVHKSCALAAQTFMLSIAAEGFESCPMEGFDAVRVKQALGLPKMAEVNMIISVGKGTEAGIWGERRRVPFEEVVIIK